MEIFVEYEIRNIYYKINIAINTKKLILQLIQKFEKNY